MLVVELFSYCLPDPVHFLIIFCSKLLCLSHTIEEILRASLDAYVYKILMLLNSCKYNVYMHA